MRAIILAAGEGTRLQPYTVDRPKCLVELAGKPLLAHQIASLESAGVTDITIVTGYRAAQIADWGYRTRHNPDYASSNMVASLMCAADVLEGSDDVLIAYADIVYETRILEALCACPAAIATTVDLAWLPLWKLRSEDPLSDAETLKLDAVGNILELGQKTDSYDDIEGQYMGLIKVRADKAQELVATYQQLDPHRLYDGKDRLNLYMTSFLQYLIDHGQSICAVLVNGGWLEVDSASDLELFNRMYDDGSLDEYWHMTMGEEMACPC